MGMHADLHDLYIDLCSASTWNYIWYEVYKSNSQKFWLKIVSEVPLLTDIILVINLQRKFLVV